METQQIDYPLLARLIAAELSKTVPEWLDTAGAAAYLSLSEKTLAEYRQKGTGPRYSKIGKHCRYNTTDLDTFARSKAHAS